MSYVESEVGLTVNSNSNKTLTELTGNLTRSSTFQKIMRKLPKVSLLPVMTVEEWRMEYLNCQNKWVYHPGIGGPMCP